MLQSDGFQYISLKLVAGSVGNLTELDSKLGFALYNFSIDLFGEDFNIDEILTLDVDSEGSIDISYIPPVLKEPVVFEVFVKTSKNCSFSEHVLFADMCLILNFFEKSQTVVTTQIFLYNNCTLHSNIKN